MQIHFSREAEGVALVELDAPPANPLSMPLRRHLEEVLDGIEDDTAIRAVILTGRGKGFCAGDDLTEALGRPADQRIHAIEHFNQLMDRIEGLRVPVIAAVNGFATGGGLELALACDIRLCSDRAFFAAAGVNVGLAASFYRLPRLIGLGPAKSVLLTGDRIEATRAYELGLVTGVHAPEDLVDAARALARRIATRAPLSVEATKRLSGRALDFTADEMARQASPVLTALSLSADHAHALEAFSLNQTPNFTRS
jgi:enoyl-CoA hydratase/carnithine racemase